LVFSINIEGRMGGGGGCVRSTTFCVLKSVKRQVRAALVQPILTRSNYVFYFAWRQQIVEKSVGLCNE
jgi:hypothetical protein